MTTKTDSPKTRRRRTAQERIADLERQKEKINAQEAARAARSSEHGKLFIAAVRAVDRALPTATEAKGKSARAALLDARERLGEHLAEIGVEVTPREPRTSRKAKDSDLAA